jgi:hypothetical protein
LTSSLHEGVPNQQVAKPVPNSSYPRMGTHQDERMGDRPTVLESRVHGVSGTSITVGNTRRCAVCSTTGLIHAVRLTNRQGATNPRRPLAPNLPVLRFEPNPPALTLSTHGYEVIAREAIRP